MDKYRKKPVVIEAAMFDGENPQAILEWCKDAAFVTLPPTGYYLCIRTLEGEMKVAPGDYVIQGVKGEFYPCKPDIFEATYEMVKP